MKFEELGEVKDKKGVDDQENCQNLIRSGRVTTKKLFHQMGIRG